MRQQRTEPTSMMAKSGVINRSSTMLVIVGIVFIVIICVGYTSLDLDMKSKLYGAGISSSVQNTAAQRLASYCNIAPPLRTSHSGNINDNWDLQYLAVNIRHGDRAAIHKLPGTVSSKPLAEANDNRTAKYVEKLKSFHLAALPGKVSRYNFEQDEEIDLKVAMNPRKTLKKPDISLSPGQLTTRGFMQHIELGSLFHDLYIGFLEKVATSQLYVRSTNYARTVQSVSALLITMMPHLANEKRKVPIRYFPHEQDEIMHGLGVRLTYHAANNVSATDAETVSSGGCAASVRSAAKQAQAFVENPVLREDLIARLGEQLRRKPVGHMADALLPAFCHARPLPCSMVEDKVRDGNSGVLTFLRTRPDGADQNAAAAVGDVFGAALASKSHCVNQRDLELIMGDADRQYCGRFGGAEGGLAATKLSIFPFLKEFTEHITLSALHGAARTEKVSIFSGHDTVIAPVLAGLGIYTDELCVWPGYASNIVVELWQPRKNVADSAAAGTTANLQTLFPGLWETAKPAQPSSYAQSFVRVYFNGEDVTQRIPTCRAERGLVNTDIRARALSEANSGGGGSGVAGDSTAAAQALRKQLLAQIVVEDLTLCSLDALVGQVASLVAPHGNIVEACGAL